MSMWTHLRQILFPVAVCAVLLSSCVTGIRNDGDSPASSTRVLEVDGRCWVSRVGGDCRGVATYDGRVVLAGEGFGIVTSFDGGRSFEVSSHSSRLRWPSLATDGSRVWVASIRSVSAGSQAAVASLGESIGPWSPAVTSGDTLIDTELVALESGRLLLFVTEVVGPANSSTGVYTVHCFQSTDGGFDWQELSTPVVGSQGVNIEDPRAVVIDRDTVLLAFEWEQHEGEPSEIRLLKSDDGGLSWVEAGRLFDGHVADLEPGGFALVGEDLWFVASSDAEDLGASYAGAQIQLVRSADRASSWSQPEVLIAEPGQLSMGAIVLPDAVLLPSLRFYKSLKRRSLAVYRVDPVGRWRLPCVEGSVFFGSFESNLDGWIQPRPKMP